MQVLSVNKNESHQSNFNGVVDKSVRKYVEKNVKSHIKNSLSKANEGGVEINKRDLVYIKEESDNILAKLDKFMGKLHPDTKLKCDENSFLSPRIFLENKKDKVRFSETLSNKSRIEDNYIYMKNYKPIYDSASIKRHGYHIKNILESMSRFVEEFTALDPTLIDEAMFVSKLNAAKAQILAYYTDNSFIKLGLGMKKSIKSLYEYSKKLGKDKAAESLINNVKQDAKKEAEAETLKRIKAQEQHLKIVQNNNDFVQDLLK